MQAPPPWRRPKNGARWLLILPGRKLMDQEAHLAPGHMTSSPMTHYLITGTVICSHWPGNWSEKLISGSAAGLWSWSSAVELVPCPVEDLWS